jgi:hypothetical protein
MTSAATPAASGVDSLVPPKSARPIVLPPSEFLQSVLRLPWCEPPFPIRDSPRNFGVGLIQSNPLDRRDEPVAAPVQRLDESRTLGAVADHRAQALDGRGEAVLEVDERAVGPQPLTQLLPREELARLPQQHRQHFVGLILQANPHAVLAQLPRPHVQLESSGTCTTRLLCTKVIGKRVA